MAEEVLAVRGRRRNSQRDPMATAASLLSAALEAWSPVDLSATRHAALDKQGLDIADNQEQSAAGRRLLLVVRDIEALLVERRVPSCAQVDGRPRLQRRGEQRRSRGHRVALRIAPAAADGQHFLRHS